MSDTQVNLDCYRGCDNPDVPELVADLQDRVFRALVGNGGKLTDREALEIANRAVSERIAELNASDDGYFYAYEFSPPDLHIWKNPIPYDGMGL